jgi:hypothetical protein
MFLDCLEMAFGGIDWCQKSLLQAGCARTTKLLPLFGGDSSIVSSHTNNSDDEVICQTRTYSHVQFHLSGSDLFLEQNAASLMISVIF